MKTQGHFIITIYHVTLEGKTKRKILEKTYTTRDEALIRREELRNVAMYRNTSFHFQPLNELL